MSIITRHALVCDECGARGPWKADVDRALWGAEGWKHKSSDADYPARHLCPDCAKEEE